MRAERSIVVDTNVLISAALSTQSPPARLVRHCLLNGRLLFSDATFSELQTRIWRPKFDRYLSMEDRTQLLHDFGAAGVWVDVPPELAAQTWCRDTQDDMFVHVALAGAASWLVSSDQDLLGLRKVQSVDVLSPAQVCALARI